MAAPLLHVQWGALPQRGLPELTHQRPREIHHLLRHHLHLLLLPRQRPHAQPTRRHLQRDHQQSFRQVTICF